MAESDVVKMILAKKAAGVERMRARQQRVHSRLADHIDAHPDAIEAGLKKVRELISKPMCNCEEIYHEWERILKLESVSYVSAILRDTSQTTEQLRACAPFTLAES